MKQSYAYKGSYNIDILNSFNPEVQLKDTESAIKNKIPDLLTELKDFEFVTVLVLEIQKIESDGKTYW